MYQNKIIKQSKYLEKPVVHTTVYMNSTYTLHEHVKHVAVFKSIL